MLAVDSRKIGHTPSKLVALETTHIKFFFSMESCIVLIASPHQTDSGWMRRENFYFTLLFRKKMNTVVAVSKMVVILLLVQVIIHRATNSQVQA